MKQSEGVVGIGQEADAYRAGEVNVVVTAPLKGASTGRSRG